jgi:hypothetical protein
MSLDRVKQKLEEAQSFYTKMEDQERSRFGPTMQDQEPSRFSTTESFESLVSAFLDAGYSVNETLRKYEINRFPPKERAKCSQWLAHWKQHILMPEERKIFHYMKINRGKEVHNQGASHKVKVEKRTYVGTHLDPSTGSFVHMTAPHGVPLGEYDIKRYLFIIDGTEEPALEVCAQYLALLRRMVMDFEAAHPCP